MKRSGLLAFVAVLAIATVLSSPPFPGVALSDAAAQTPAPTPTVTEPPALPEPAPVPEPEPPSAPAAPEPDVGGNGGTDTPPATPGSGAGGGGGGGSNGGGSNGGGGAHRAPAPDTSDYATTIWWSSRPSYSGLYSSSHLVDLAERVKGGGPAAYAPFIIAGHSTWSDTWGGIRRASDTGLRPHLGQDVFCDYGAPVLASEHGWIDHGSDANGGLVARLHRSDGSYWYYAHLSAYNPSVPSGASVSPGDVIGYCGTSGNAVGSPPHVHFGLYSGGVALNPMGALIGWLDSAERNAAALVAKQERRTVRPGRKNLRTGAARPKKISLCPRLPAPPPPPVPVAEILLPGAAPDSTLVDADGAGIGATGPTFGRDGGDPPWVVARRPVMSRTDAERRVVRRDRDADPARYLEALPAKDASIEVEVVPEVVPAESLGGGSGFLEETLHL